MADVTFTQEEIAAFPQGPPGPQGDVGPQGIPGSGLPSVIDLGDYVTDFTGGSDQSAQVSAAIAALPATGGILWHPGGRIRVAAIDLATKRIRIAGIVGGLDGDTSFGSWFVSAAPSQTMFLCKPGTLRQSGPALENVGLADLHGGCTLIDTLNTNRVKLRDVTLLGYTDQTTVAIIFDFSGSFDSSWHLLEDVNFRNVSVGISGRRTFGGVMSGGEFIGCAVGADMQQPTGNWRFVGVKGDGGNPCFNLVGYNHKCVACDWEVTGTSPRVGFRLDGGASPGGRGNSLIACSGTGRGAAGQIGFEITANAQGTTAIGFAAANLAVPFTDAGLRSTIVGGYGLGLATVSFGPTRPQGVVTANPGSLFGCNDGTLWLKTSGTGSTGWTQK